MQTHLGGEEYFPDARAFADLLKKSPGGQEWTKERYATWVTSYLGLPANATNADVAKAYFPYHYGYAWEVRACFFLVAL
jgi:hypothetical protein